MNRDVRKDEEGPGLADVHAQFALSVRASPHTLARSAPRPAVATPEQEGGKRPREEELFCACRSQGASAFSKNKNED